MSTTTPRLSRSQFDMVTQLLHVGNYGDTQAEVIEYLIRRSLDDLLRAGVVKVAPAPRRGPPPLPGETP